MNFIGRTLGRYRIVAPLGQGAMAHVFRAVHEELGREVALKVPHVQGDFAHEADARFRREARLLASVKHPGVVEITDIDEADGIRFIAMTLVESPTLDHVLARGRLPEERVIALGVSLCEALAAIHDAGIVHRDVKPSNVFVGPEDRAILGDFGVARPLGEHTVITADGTAIGTFMYMAPEQHRDEPVDARSDQYSAALVLYRAACGALPFAGNIMDVVRAKTDRATLPGPRSLIPDLSRDLDAVLVRACRAKPAERFADMRALAAALAAVKPRAPRRAGDTPRMLVVNTPSGLMRTAKASHVRARRAFAAGALVVTTLLAVGMAARGLRRSTARTDWVPVESAAPPPPAVASTSHPPLIPPRAPRGVGAALDLALTHTRMQALWPGYVPSALERDLAGFTHLPRSDPRRRDVAAALLIRLGATLPLPTMRAMAERGLIFPDYLPYLAPALEKMKVDRGRWLPGSTDLFIEEPLLDVVGRAGPDTALALFLNASDRSVELIDALRRFERPSDGITTLDLVTLNGYLCFAQPGFQARAGEQVYQLFVRSSGASHVKEVSAVGVVHRQARELDAIIRAHVRLAGAQGGR